MFNKVINWLKGRSTMFAIYFTIMGTVMAWFGKLDPNFIMLIGAVQGLVIAHSAKEDYFAGKRQDKDKEVVDTNGDSNGATK
jgi:hypothetical protein